MKFLKIILTFLVVTAGLVTTLAFAGKSDHKSFSTVTYYYNGTKNTRISPGFSNSLVGSEVTDQSMWDASASATSGKGDHLLAISFDNSQLTLQQAITALWHYYINNSYTLPPNNFTVVIKGVTITITVHRKAA
ncbi:MAG: hypothetical protein Q8941_18510 [Bacteroidota bacterium]|nr:hypothetical protein [Bacteroidota bacterium]